MARPSTRERRALPRGCQVERRKALDDLLRGRTTIECGHNGLDRDTRVADAKHAVLVSRQGRRPGSKCLHAQVMFVSAVPRQRCASA